MTAMPRVSVIIPVYNGAASVGAAIESVLAQTFTDYEIVCVDDGSSDASLEVLSRFEPRVRVLRQANQGPSAARNLGVRNSTGALIGFLDADDLWHPEFLQRTVALLDREPACVMVYTDLAIADSTGRDLHARLIGDRAVPTVEDMLERLWPILPSSVLIRRSAYERAGGFPEALRAFEDVYFWLLVREVGEFRYLPEPLATWRFSLFPDPLKPGGGQEEAGRVFELMVRRRYGRSGHLHVVGRRRAPRSILGFIALAALREGDRRRARAALLRALRFDPFRIKNYLRLARTFLPGCLSRMMAGKKGRAA
jgi:glycosyltransferase involved in cell wall biosynthesis